MKTHTRRSMLLAGGALLGSGLLSGCKKYDQLSLQSLTNLNQIGLACLNFHKRKGFFPNDYRDQKGKPLLSWRVRILAYLARLDLFEMFKLDEPWDSPDNIAMQPHMPSLYRYPRDNESVTSTRIQVAVGPGTPFATGEKFGLDAIKDPLDQTIMLIETGANKEIPWTKPEDCDFDPVNPVKGLGNVSDNHMQAVFFDGHAVRLNLVVEPDVLRAVFRHTDGVPNRAEFDDLFDFKRR